MYQTQIAFPTHYAQPVSTLYGVSVTVGAFSLPELSQPVSPNFFHLSLHLSFVSLVELVSPYISDTVVSTGRFTLPYLGGRVVREPNSEDKHR